MSNEYSIRKVQGIVGENSLSIILPKSYAVDLGINKGDYVVVKQEGRRIWIEKESEYRFSSIQNGGQTMTPQNPTDPSSQLASTFQEPPRNDKHVNR